LRALKTLLHGSPISFQIFQASPHFPEAAFTTTQFSRSNGSRLRHARIVSVNNYGHFVRNGYRL